MDSSTDIANFALSCLGSAPLIQDLDSDTSKEARVCRTFYTDLLKQALHSFNWHWATTFVQLNPIAFYPTPEWAFVYASPNDLMRISRIWNGKHTDDLDTTQQWDLAVVNGQKAILSNFGPNGLLPLTGPFVPSTTPNPNPSTIDPSTIPVLTYVQYQKNVALMPELFKMALGMAIAAFAGPAIPGIGQVDLFEKWIGRANAKLVEAASQDINESRVKPERRSLIEMAGHGVWGGPISMQMNNNVPANFQI